MMGPQASPTDQRLEKLLAGEPLISPPRPSNTAAEPAEVEELRSIPANWLVLLRKDGVVRVPITIRGAVITGDVAAWNTTFESSVVLMDCEFTGSVNFSFSKFRQGLSIVRSRFTRDLSFVGAEISGVVFEATSFGAANFSSTRVMGNALFGPDDTIARLTSFHGTANFGGMEVTGSMNFNAVDFQGNVDFASCQVKKDLVVLSAVFHGKTDFTGMVGGTISLIDAEFRAATSFRTAKIDGDLAFRGAAFRDPVDFVTVSVGGSVHFRNGNTNKLVEFGAKASFVGLTVGRSIYLAAVAFRKDVDFGGMEIKEDLFISPEDHWTTPLFGGNVNFSVGEVKGNVICDGVEFQADANFWSWKVEGNIHFRLDHSGQPTTFHRAADFVGIEAGSLTFQATQFLGPATFTAVRVHGGVLFVTSRARHGLFEGPVSFTSADIKGGLQFESVVCRRDVNLIGIKVGGSAIFRTCAGLPPTTFEGTVDFSGGSTGESLSCIGVTFRNRVTFLSFRAGEDLLFVGESEQHPIIVAADANFERVHVKGNATFHAIFAGKTTFASATFERIADFKHARFNKEIRFDGAKFEDEGKFVEAEFQEGASFDRVMADKQMDFFGSVLATKLSFRDAHFSRAVFGQLAQEQQRGRWARFFSGRPELQQRARIDEAAEVDVRGFTYDRIYVELNEWLPRLTPFDRQPYTQLESVLRKTGDDVQANRVYLERRRVERKEKFRFRTIFAWLFDWLYGAMAGYGVRPYYLLGYSVALIGFGVWLFAQPGALKPKPEAGAVQTVATPNRWDALDVGVRHFLPLIVPIGEAWVPTTMAVYIRIPHVWNIPVRPDWYATILRVIGTVSVGIGVAAVTGLLRRIAH